MTELYCTVLTWVDTIKTHNKNLHFTQCRRHTRLYLCDTMYCVTVEHNEMGGCRTCVLCGDTIKPLWLVHKGDKESARAGATRLCRTVAVVSVSKVWLPASHALSKTKRARDLDLKVRLA